MIRKISIVLCLAALTACAAADDRRMEQRLDDLERRVTQLEAQSNRSGSPAPVAAPFGFSGRFEDLAARRMIYLKMDRTFSLQTTTGLFTGIWQKTGDQIVIRAPSGLTETFRVVDDVLVDSQGQRWTVAKTP